MHGSRDFPFRLDGSIPFSGGKRDRHLPGYPFRATAVPIAYPAYFGQKYTAVALIQLEALRITKGIMNAFPFEARKIRTLREEILVGTVEIFQRLLQNLRVGFGKKGCIIFLFPVSKELAEQGKAQTLPFIFIGFLFQCERLVPDKTATSSKTPHEAFLPGFGAELKLAGLQSLHSRIIIGL